MHGEGFFLQAFLYLAATVVAVPLAKKLGLGSVLGYLIAGVIIGPYALGLVGAEGQDVMHFAEFGVVMMLFVVGLELQPSLLWRLRGPIVGLGGAQVPCYNPDRWWPCSWFWAQLAGRARHRYDIGAVFNGHRPPNPERKGIDEDTRRTEFLRGVALPRHRRHPDARLDAPLGHRHG